MIGQTPHECALCGRLLKPHAADAGRYSTAPRRCSACLEADPEELQRCLKASIEELLTERPGKSICPSEAARRVDPDNWRELMGPCRSAACRLWHRGRLSILKRGKPIHPDYCKGAIRLAKP